ncbi:MAG: class I SAM-dependent methyltransferase [Anaerolineae bacterium]|nr:class I SAM-dependent methyltransferase [Anaerolineae bacterium]
MPKPVVDHFGLLSPLYERLIRPPDPAQLETLMALQPGQRLLDVGGGTGRVTQIFSAVPAEITLLDPSFGMLQQAKAKVCCHPLRSSAEHIPFKSGVYDRILAVDSFHHFWDQATAAAELVRVLAPGGRLVIEEPDIRRFAVKLVALGERLTLMRSRFFAPEALAALFRATGAQVQLHTPDAVVNFWAVIEKP